MGWEDKILWMCGRVFFGVVVRCSLLLCGSGMESKMQICKYGVSVLLNQVHHGMRIAGQITTPAR